MMSADSEQSRLTQLFDELSVSVLVIGRNDGIIRYINDRVCRDMGKTHGEIQGHSYRQIFWPEFIPLYEHLQKKCVDNSEHSAIYYWAEMQIWEQVSACIVIWDGYPCILLTISNISEVAYNKFLTEQNTFFDPLLNLPNGAKLEEDVNDLAGLEALNLIYFVIERFEEINDVYGWENGDHLLKQIRDWLLAGETQRMQLYRVNNGFVLMGRNVTLQATEARAEEILQRFTQPWLLSAAGNALTVFCTIKMGVVHGKYVRNEMRSLLTRTLQAPKNARGYSVYDDKAAEQARRTLMLRDYLISCMRNNMQGFKVYYQPIVETKTRKWVALEALCRWELPGGDRISPGEFIPMAEQLDIIGVLDDWVRKTAMEQCVSLGLDKKNFILDINFSPTRKISSDYVEELQNTLLQTGFPPKKLNLEITESAKMDFSADNMRGLEQLLNKGIILSLDDFGTGYSSFESLIQISATILKMERVFLDGIERDSYRQYLLRMLVDLAAHLNMKIVSEGVETEEQLALLQRYGVELAQGYLFSMPMPFEQLRREVWRFE